MNIEPSARRAARGHHPRRTLLTLLGTALLIAGLVPVIASPAHAFPPPPPTCDDGSAPPCEPEPEPDPEPDPGPDPTPAPAPDPECDDPAGFARPAGQIPPGYIYTPTKYSGAIEDPQADDTFAADAPGHNAYLGRLRTRVVNGQEQLLVCAHVGTNTPDDALTPFAKTGSGAHPPTIAPRVVLIDATGASSVRNATVVNSTLSHYRDSTDIHEGFVQMWVPLTANLREPGFTVRVEIRGTPNLPGGDTKVMGADEVFVHLGPYPVHAGGAVDQGVGLALDTGVIADTPYDPGIDDISSTLTPRVGPMVEAAVEAKAPIDFNTDYDWDFSTGSVKHAHGWVDSLDTTVDNVKLDVEPWSNPDGSSPARLNALATGTVTAKITLYPESWGIGTILGGVCHVYAHIDLNARAAFGLDIADSPTRLQSHLLFVDAWGSISSMYATGTVDVAVLPDKDCSELVDTFRDGALDHVDGALDGIDQDAAVASQVTQAIDDALDVTDLANGPLAIDEAVLSKTNGLGFRPHGWYIPTAPSGSPFDVDIEASGIDLAAAASVDDIGGSRFGYSYIPSEQLPLTTSVNDRQRPTGGSFDIGVVLSGGTVNQVARSLAAGSARDVSTDPCWKTAQPNTPTMDVGLLDLCLKTKVKQGPVEVPVDVATHPSVPPLYLPTPPPGWDAPGNVNVYVPSLRIQVSIPGAGPVGGIATMAGDARVGLDASMDGGGNLVPRLQNSKVVPRFLRLGPSTNQTTETDGPVNDATNAILDAVPDRVEVLAAYKIPALPTGPGQPPVHLRNLTVGTARGGHLGMYVDVVPDELGAPIDTTWTAPAGGQPTSFTSTITPADMPGGGPYKIQWLVRAGDKVLYRSPVEGEAATSQSLPAGDLAVRTNPCTGAQTVDVKLDVTITREWRTRAYTKTDSYTWPGPAPTQPPHWCDGPPPDPEPEPDPDPDPPICDIQSWKCPDPEQP